MAGWALQSPDRVGLADVVRNAKPTVLVGVTAEHGLFTTEVLEQVGQNDERPVVLALSNPTAKAECTPEEVARATGGRALVATGSPLPETKDIREVSRRTAIAVAIEAREEGLGRLVEDAEIDRLVTKAQWNPHYCAYRPGPPCNR